MVYAYGRTVPFRCQSNNGLLLKLVDGKSRNTIGRVSGKLKGSDPITLAHTSTGARKGYPAYEIITVRGITEIIEHRQMEPIFYIADDPRVWAELGVDRTQ